MGADSVLLHARLVPQVHPRVGWAADTDEVAAVLESTGINDSVASRDYGHGNVFTLARQVRLATARPSPDEAKPRPPLPLLGAMIRAGLYLTPTVVAVGMAGSLGTLPWYATTGLLVAGWGSAQGLAHLGYLAANESGSRAAARLLGLGFVALTAIWAALLMWLGAPAMAYLVSAAQLMLFAANTVTLVTGTERRVLAIALTGWAAVLAFMAGAGPVAVVALFAALAAMVVVGFWPAFAGGGSWCPSLRQGGVAAGHGIVGAGQAALFVLVVLTPAGTLTPIAASAPLLLGIPLTELMLLQHQRRVADGRERAAQRATFELHLRRISWLTAVPLVAPMPAALALVWLASSSDGWVLAACTLLTGINAICLVLVAHRRQSTAILLVWLSAALIAMGTLVTATLLPELRAAAAGAAALAMLCVYLPAAAVAVAAIRDPWSYR
ncbi:hypothetical protein Rhe02_49570 [Rhizocola hellebori]|uniref:Integral membrane protein n=1 Tax=Rhizocola hellebori TaxID=1392758 RepID=A0A8J3QC61_9ACTN|nr:hypothetical protein [Rhizocola hellebori]GIH06890.1 hypothetical protein Rhe02_49570 [Rhizocola hellebori]